LLVIIFNSSYHSFTQLDETQDELREREREREREIEGQKQKQTQKRERKRG